jgi:diguanylate cyclase (GGDEF)-like protein/PAS domain S-box-containing protein
MVLLSLMPCVCVSGRASNRARSFYYNLSMEYRNPTTDTEESDEIEDYTQTVIMSGHVELPYQSDLLEIEQVDLVFKQLLLSLSGGTMVLLFFSYTLRDSVERPVLLSWMGATLVLYIVRMLYVRTYQRLNSEQRAKQVRFWKLNFLIGTLLSGMAWGIGCVMLMPEDPVYEAFIVVVLAGLSAATGLTYAALRYGGILFIVPAMLPLIFYFAWNFNEVHFTMGILVFLYMLLVSASSYQMYLTTRATLELSSQKKDLIEQLKQSNKQTMKLNLSLQKQMVDRRQAEERFRRLSDASIEGVMIHDKGRIIDVNRRFIEMFGYSMEELRNINVIDLVAPESQDRIRSRIDIPQENVLKLFARHKDGSLFPIEVHGKDLPLGEATLRVVVIHDLSQRLATEKALSDEKERALVTLESIGDGVVTTDSDGNINYINPVAEDLTGWSMVEAMGHKLADIMHLSDQSTGEAIPDPVVECLTSLEKIYITGETILQGTQGTQRYSIEITVSPIRGSSGSILGTVLVFHDVTVLQTMAQQMSHQATHDALTGLINRIEFEHRLVDLITDAHKNDHEHAMCYLDLDEFKVVNDTSGHAAGDRLLQELSAQLEDCIRESDALARLGGDEFGVLLVNCPPGRAMEIAESMRERVKDYRMAWEEHVHDVGVSIGLVPITADSGELSEILREADSACYVAKDRGRNRVHAYEKDDVELARHHGTMQWMQKIQRALEQDNFLLYYQPIRDISIQTSSTWHAELLIRMVSNEGEIITPDHFLPAAERYHLMVDIDRWVISKALNMLARLKASIKPDTFLCAINLSGQSLSDDHILGFLISEIENSGLDPENLCFEITETSAIANIQYAQRFMSILRGMGCSFALDDFGSGLSSFAYLKRLPIDFLKIDGSFVRNILHDKTDYAMVKSIQQIGEVMGISTIAEFVESESVVQQLKILGVDYAQGYYLGEPASLSDLLKPD